MSDIRIDPRACIGCGACVNLCTGSVFRMGVEGAEVVAAERCWGCGHCVAVCPADAIDHPLFPLEECPLLGDGVADVPARLLSVLRGRRSVRAFQSRSLDRDLLREILDVGRLAPSASNRQPVDWVAFDDPARIRELSRTAATYLARWGERLRRPAVGRLLGLLLGGQGKQAVANAGFLIRLGEAVSAGEDPIFFRAPVVLVAHTPQGAAFARDDAAYAAHNVMLYAAASGLGTCQIGLFQLAMERMPSLRRSVGIPPGRTSQVILCLGYPRDPFRRSLPRRRPEVAWNPR